MPDLDVGPAAEREGEEAWKVGPSITVPLPVFDQGQGRIGRAVAGLRRAQQEYYALAVRVRATARAVQERVVGAQDQVFYYRDILLPLRERIVNEAQLHYNAMQIGVLQLLRDREQEIETAVAYVEVLRDYWLARTDLSQIASGRLPSANSLQGTGGGGSMKMNGSERH
jgi:cobalt-zinc-cadmium efflux system outer membrane protein